LEAHPGTLEGLLERDFRRKAEGDERDIEEVRLDRALESELETVRLDIGLDIAAAGDIVGIVEEAGSPDVVGEEECSAAQGVEYYCSSETKDMASESVDYIAAEEDNFGFAAGEGLHSEAVDFRSNRDLTS